MKTTVLLFMVLITCAPAPAAEIKSQQTARVGTPETAPDPVVRGPVDPGDLDRAQTPSNVGDPVLEVRMEKDVYEAGEPIELNTRLNRRDKSGVEDADVRAIVDDKRTIKLARKVKGQKGEYVAPLDDTPGEHNLEVYADAVVDGTSVHRATSYFYVVANGNVRVKDHGRVRIDATTVRVPLELSVTAHGYYTIDGTLVARGIIVAYAKTGAFIEPGEDTVDLTFNRADLVESGPYALRAVTVTQSGPSGRQIATAPRQVGEPFDVPRPRAP
jgi:hypothetical protein